MKIKNIYTDVLVIGSGPGGAISGYEIKKKTQLNVLILERGKSKSTKLKPYSSQEMDEAYYKGGLSTCIGKGNLVLATAETLGGGSEINSGFFRELPKKVGLNWKKIINDFSLNDISQNLKKIGAILKVNSKNKDEGKASKVLKKGSDKLKLRSMRVSRWIKSKKINGTWHHLRYGMINTYLKMFKDLGGIIKTNAVALKICGYDKIKKIYTVKYLENNRTKYIECKYVFVCGGALMTPEFLLNSGIKKNIGNSLMLHQMSRLVAEFKEEKNENNFGVPVRQVDQYMSKMTFGCSVSTKQHLALWMSDNNNLIEVLKNYKKYSVYYALINSQTRGKVLKTIFNTEPIVFYNITKKDIKDNQDAIKKLGKILFLGGAKKIYLSSGNASYQNELSFKNVQELNIFINSKNYIPELSSIHLFSSVRMGRDENCPLNSYGKLKEGSGNIYVNDASMLPTSVGVNPQGIIMALAKRNVENFIQNIKTQ